MLSTLHINTMIQMVKFMIDVFELYISLEKLEESYLLERFCQRIRFFHPCKTEQARRDGIFVITVSL